MHTINKQTSELTLRKYNKNNSPGRNKLRIDNFSLEI